jgi:hypothetical protein
MADIDFDALEGALADPAALADLRRRFDDELVAEHGQEWFDWHKMFLDADWAGAVALLGGAVEGPRVSEEPSE